MVVRFRYLFLDGKKRVFLFFCQAFAVKTVFIALMRDFVAMKTVFIALMRDFVAMKTVVITDYHGPHGNDDRLHGEKLRTSREKGWKNPLA